MRPRAASARCVGGNAKMRAVYTICPFCEFPAVLAEATRYFPHRCRQCAEVFLPAAAAAHNPSPRCQREPEPAPSSNPG